MRVLHANHLRGQALIESVSILMIFFGILIALIAFTQWFLVRQKLLIAVREGAMLYSSGRVTAAETERRMRFYLGSGSVALRQEPLQIYVGQLRGTWQAAAWRLDEIRARYKNMEEKCVIKHAPHYGPPRQTLYGPPVPW